MDKEYGKTSDYNSRIKNYKSVSVPSRVKQTSNPVIRPVIRVNKIDNASQHPSDCWCLKCCPEPKTKEQPVQKAINEG